MSLSPPFGGFATFLGSSPGLCSSAPPGPRVNAHRIARRAQLAGPGAKQQEASHRSWKNGRSSNWPPTARTDALAQKSAIFIQPQKLKSAKIRFLNVCPVAGTTYFPDREAARGFSERRHSCS